MKACNELVHQQTDLGFNPAGLLTMRVALPWRKYGGEQGRNDRGSSSGNCSTDWPRCPASKRRRNSLSSQQRL